MSITQLNYHHLYYFWTIATEGSIAEASRKLRLAQPTLSTQLKQLEDQLGVDLFHRKNRQLVLTETGRTALKYAEEIFSLGGEFLGALRGIECSGMAKLRIGVIDSFPKHLTYELLRPLTELEYKTQISCFEGKRVELLAQLATHDLDLVLADTSTAHDLPINAYYHSLGSCPVAAFATPKMATKAKRNFPQCLETLPVLMPTPNTHLRREIDKWLIQEDIIPNMLAEFEDSALMKVFASHGEGIVFLPAIMEKEAKKSLQLSKIKVIPDVVESAFLISLEKKVNNPVVSVVIERAKKTIYSVR